MTKIEKSTQDLLREITLENAAPAFKKSAPKVKTTPLASQKAPPQASTRKKASSAKPSTSAAQDDSSEPN